MYILFFLSTKHIFLKGDLVSWNLNDAKKDKTKGKLASNKDEPYHIMDYLKKKHLQGWRTQWQSFL